MMGFTPEQVDRMSLWAFSACIEGYAAAHGSEKQAEGEPMSIDRMRDLGLL
ncbi:hypothetical protein [uncultured Mameliella sp.]|uniref:hypothetical protein n=1 Tax=uncultured Mameliella sp. TaxID=1447087 RepID=UPI002610D9EE|nr:hypothetical protein [uncultured Mameliella sp.]